MTRNQKYNYDIKKIQALENKGVSIRAIARKHGWDEDNTQQWIHRHFKRVIKVTYIPKAKRTKDD